MRCLLGAVLLCCSAASAVQGETILVENGQAKAALFVPDRLLDDRQQNPEPNSVQRTWKPEDQRRRLRESVFDFVGIVERVSGAKLDVISGPPAANEGRIAILVGELATARFGAPRHSAPAGQGLRIVVQDRAVGLCGESDLGTSYALYTLLDQLGCRWYMPSPLGEVLPELPSIALAAQDTSLVPRTHYRGVWYCDNDFARRNRLGGLEISAGHALEYSVPKELRISHPEIRAIIKGQPHPHLIKWTHPLVADAVADSILARLEKEPHMPSASLSPDDGATWDESDDARYDAGDFDPANQCISKTDRLMVFANRVAAKVSAQHPQVKLGILAYADYTRPPVREKLHPALVPQIAPITFSRAHPMNDEGEPNNRGLRGLVEGWGRAVPETSYYLYAFNLAEVATPNPMLTKWGHDLPYIYQHGRCKYWQPETMSNFESCLHALYLGIRLAWDEKTRPEQLFDELHTRFYGAAAEPMSDYWHAIDRAWVATPEYSGCGFGHLRRFPPQMLAAAQGHLERAASAARTEPEQQRVRLARESFDLFAHFMQLRRDLADGRWPELDSAASRYVAQAQELGAAHQAQFAFARMGWTGERTVNVRYFEAFYKKTYDDAARVAREGKLLSSPLVTWRYQADEKKAGEAAGWMKPDYDDASWKQTQVCLDTWSTLGMHNYMGSVWYRTTVQLDQLPPGKKCYLWIGATDGRVKPFVNGQPVAWQSPKNESLDSFSGYCQPVSFEITAALRSGQNQISLFCTREFINELGTGGLLAPVAVYAEK